MVKIASGKSHYPTFVGGADHNGPEFFHVRSRLYTLTFGEIKLIPCKQCLCLSICRNKDIDTLMKQCSLVLEWFDTKNETDPDVIAEKVGDFIIFIRPYLITEDKKDDTV